MTATPLRTVCLESRRRDELARLLERHGLVPIAAPSLREVPLEDQAEAHAFGEALLARRCDVLVLLTGVGARALLDALFTRFEREHVLRALSGVTLCCRGPKPVAVLKELGLKPSVLAPEPNTWRELCAELERLPLAGKHVWVQEYGRRQVELRAALTARGAELHSAAVYAWALPEDIAPLERAITSISRGEVDALVCTSATQIEHLLSVAERLGLRERVLETMAASMLIASIGPVTSDALRAVGVTPDLEPEHPKLGHLAKALAERGRALLDRKRARYT